MQGFVKTISYYMPRLTESLIQGVQLHSNISQHIPNYYSHSVFSHKGLTVHSTYILSFVEQENCRETDEEKCSNVPRLNLFAGGTHTSKLGQYWSFIAFQGFLYDHRYIINQKYNFLCKFYTFSLWFSVVYKLIHY